MQSQAKSAVHNKFGGLNKMPRIKFVGGLRLRSPRPTIFIMPDYRRMRVSGGQYFFTVNLANRCARLLTENIELLHCAFRQVQERHPFSMLAHVILPDHLHCIWRLPPDDDDYSTRWLLIKTKFTRMLPQSARHARGVWQRRFWEHLIRDETDFRRHADYIHYNPVKHEHAKSAMQWPHSSFHRYVKEGIYPPNWGGGNAHKNIAAGE